MKKIISIVLFLFFTLGYSQEFMGTWYLINMDGEDVVFNEEIPNIRADFKYDNDSGRWTFESQICGYLKSEIVFFLCECYKFEVLETIEQIGQSCESEESTNLQNKFFSHFINADGQQYNRLYYYSMYPQQDGTMRLSMWDDAYEMGLEFSDHIMETSDYAPVGVTPYPNPTKNLIFLSEKVKKLEVFNPVGQKLMSKTNTEKLDLSALPNGIYIISTVRYNGNRKTFKIIKE